MGYPSLGINFIIKFVAWLYILFDNSIFNNLEGLGVRAVELKAVSYGFKQF